MSTLSATLPAAYATNTDETDALALNMTNELAVGETVASAACELRRRDDNTDVTATGLSIPATVADPVVTQRFDARVLEPGPYWWIWNVTLNTGAVRSYRTAFNVESHD